MCSGKYKNVVLTTSVMVAYVLCIIYSSLGLPRQGATRTEQLIIDFFGNILMDPSEYSRMCDWLTGSV